MDRSLLVIGLGNDDRGDDAAGLLAARRVRELRPELPVIEAAGPVELLDCWKGVRRVFLVDAVVSGLAPGIVHRLEPLGAPLPVDLFRCSTHAFGIAETIELARALDMLPRELVLFGIEGARFEPGSSLSPEVEVAAADVARRIAAEAATDA